MLEISKEALDHLLENLIQLEAEDIKTLHLKMRLNCIPKFPKIMYDEITKHKTAGNITTLF